MTGRTGKVFKGLGSLSTENNLTVLRRLMLELKPQTTLEVGLGFGGSCLVFAASHRDMGHAPQRQHVALDPFQASVWDDSGLTLVEKAGLAGFLDFRATSSSLELPKLLVSGGRFGVIYVDGSHLFEDVFVDAFFGARLLDDEGVIAFDDSSNPHVHKVLKFIRTNCPASLEEIDLGKYRSDSGRSLPYRLGSALGRLQMTAFRRIANVGRAWDAVFKPF